MRWIGSIVVALCLVGATTPRPRAWSEGEPTGTASHVELVKSSTGVALAPRRAAPAPDLRIAPFVVPAAPAITAPPRAAYVTAAGHRANPLVTRTLPRTSRGPPSGIVRV